MENKLKYILDILFILLVVGCFDDEGNYSYIKISDIELSGIEKDYRKYSMQDSLIIPVTVKTEYDKSDLRYVWFIYKGSDMESVDTISRERDLVYPVVEDEGEYTVLLQ